MVYHIVIVFDENYVQHAGVMLCSLFETNSDKVFTIHAFTNGITHDSECKLSYLCSHYKSEILFYQPDKDFKQHLNYDLSKLPVGQWTTMMYYKLFMPLVLSPGISRCLFLDVDMIIHDNIAPLYDWDLNGKIIAAAEDIPDCVKIKKQIGLSPSDSYINSGVMVCDLEKWRKLENEKPIFDFVLSVEKKITNEQDVIALYFQGLLGLLPIRWNMVTFYFNRVPYMFSKYKNELQDSKRNPGIIHFAAPIKPWFRDCQHPYRNLYRKHLLSFIEYAEIPTGKSKRECRLLLQFPYWEQLTFGKRIKKTIKNTLNYWGILKYEGYTPPIK